MLYKGMEDVQEANITVNYTETESMENSENITMTSDARSTERENVDVTGDNNTSSTQRNDPNLARNNVPPNIPR